MENPLSQITLSGLFRTSSKDPNRIINREGTIIEFKESYSHSGMSMYFKMIAAFANNSGGYLFFGIGERPRRLIGLSGKNMEQFENLRVEEFSKNLNEYFSPEIEWIHCGFEFREKYFGVIYVYPLRRKPCVCKKSFDARDNKYSLKEGDIYYRYNGRSERIKYPELLSILENSRREEEERWLELMKQIAHIGMDNVALLNLNNGYLANKNGTNIVIDEALLSKIAFIKEGHFVDIEGKPTLRLIGDIKNLSTSQIIVPQTKHIVKSIEPYDIVKTFLKRQDVEEPLGYIKRICSTTTAYYPIYYYIKQAHLAVTTVIDEIKLNTIRGPVKEKLIERLGGKYIDMKTMPPLKTKAAQAKNEYKNGWINESLPAAIADIGYCVEAILYLGKDEIIEHEQYICETLLKIYDAWYEGASSVVASNIRKVICRVDETLNAE